MLKLLFFIFIIACNYQADGKYMYRDTIGGEIKSDKEKLAQINRLFSEYESSFKGVKSITPKEVDDLDNVLFVDVREKNEYEVSIIPNAITLKEFKDNSQNYKERNIVVYCTIGYRSGVFTKKLIQKGFHAFNLKGGVLLWSHDKRAFSHNFKNTKKVHVYGKNWDLLESSYTAIY